MSYDVHDTIAAAASAPGGAARGLVRISGPATRERLAHCFVAQSGAELAKLDRPTRVNGSFRVRTEMATGAMQIPGALLVWPGNRSYTKEPSAEFHTIGSPPLLAAVLEELGRNGVRPAAPGEFTLRAFLGGRIDLIQAEGVLGVIDARPDELDAALDQLAGGISLPLRRIREDLLSLLAELEAGLDFVEEDIEFISRESLAERLAHAQQVVSSTQAQLAARDRRNEAPRVALVGPPNAGKSSLFNALAERFGERDAAKSIVSAQPGATRDYVICRLDVGGTTCELIDTAGTVEVNEADARGTDCVQSATQMATSRQRRAADVRLICADARNGANIATGFGEIGVLTKIDLLSESEASASLAPGSLSPATAQGSLRDPVSCSAVTGAGLEVLASQIRAAIGQMTGEYSKPAAAAATANRCRESLRQTAASLETAVSLVGARADELLAAEIRTGLDGLGQVVGAICADDILDRVFGQFCIGK